MFTEKRTFPRFKITIPLIFFERIFNKSSSVQTHDIGTQGVSIVADEKLPSGSDLDMRIQMPDNNEKICVKGKVIWARAINSDKYRIGIKLKESILKPIPLVLRTIMAQRKY